MASILSGGRPDSVITLVLSFIGMAHYYVGYMLGGWDMAKHFLLGTFKLLNSLFLFPWFWYDAYSIIYKKKFWCPFGSVDMLDPTRASDGIARSLVQSGGAPDTPIDASAAIAKLLTTTPAVAPIPAAVAPITPIAATPIVAAAEATTAATTAATEAVKTAATATNVATTAATATTAAADAVKQAGGSIDVTNHLFFYLASAVIAGLIGYLGWQLYKNYLGPKLRIIYKKFTTKLEDVKLEGEKITESFETGVMEPLRKKESEYTNKTFSPKNQQLAATTTPQLSSQSRDDQEQDAD